MKQPQRIPTRDIADIGFCEEQSRLRSEFIQTLHALCALQTQLTQAVIDEDPDFARFDVLLHMAQERKESAKYALMPHLESHKCS